MILTNQFREGVSDGCNAVSPIAIEHLDPFEIDELTRKIFNCFCDLFVKGEISHLGLFRELVDELEISETQVAKVAASISEKRETSKRDRHVVDFELFEVRT